MDISSVNLSWHTHLAPTILVALGPTALPPPREHNRLCSFALTLSSGSFHLCFLILFLANTAISSMLSCHSWFCGLIPHSPSVFFLFTVYSAMSWLAGAFPYFWSAHWPFSYFSSPTIHVQTLEKALQMKNPAWLRRAASTTASRSASRARGAGRPVTLSDSHTTDSWPFPLLTQAHISLFKRAVPWLLLPSILTHSMHIITFTCVLPGSS